MIAIGRRSKYSTNELLFKGIQALEHRAIAYLQAKAEPMVRKWVKKHGLSTEIIEELLNNGTLVLLQKIDAGQYTYEGNDPVTYLVETTRRMAMKMASQRSGVIVSSLDEQELQLADQDYDVLNEHQNTVETLAQILAQLGQPCKQVISLHYIDGYTDEEVVTAKWTPYSTVASLKVKRSECMKKLVQIAQSWKKTTKI